VSSDLPADAAAEPQPQPTRSRRSLFLILIAGVVVLDILAFMLVPPFPIGHPGEPVNGIDDLIGANLEFPAPHVVFPIGGHAPSSIVSFDVSISSSLFTMFFVVAFVAIVAVLLTRGMTLVPKRGQNLFEWAYESLDNWAVSLGGAGARPHVPLFAALFLFILISNWSGLLPFFGKIEALRAPTSDVNVTLGLALFAFLYYHYQGFRHLGARGYLGKFFVFSGFKLGLGAGLIALFVGLIEFLLEFIKPVTLSMRLFGNIFGGEVALGVITALTIAIVPIGMLSLELLLNFVQALIFSTLTLMYTIIAIESHHEDDHAEAGHEPIPEGNIGPPVSEAQPGAAH
jgi:F-type H+-transporting ATPase subunit a